MIGEQIRDNILVATIDMPGRSMNVFSNALMDAFELIIDRVETDPAIHGLVVASGKSAFLAGADLEMAREYTKLGLVADRDELRTACGRLGRLFLRLDALPKPTVAALNGLALGGGLEVAMACRWRVAVDNPRVQLGLPEVKLGLMPCGGGTQRLPRLIGIERGLELLLNGQSVGPSASKSLGLVDQLVAKNDLIDCAVVFAKEAAQTQVPGKFPPKLAPGPFNLRDPDIVRQITRHYGYSDEVTAEYPAYDAIVRSVVEASDVPIEDGMRIELDRVVDLMQSPVAGNMVSTLFLARQRANKLLAQATRAARFAVCGTGPEAQALVSALRASHATIIDSSDSQPSDVRITSEPFDRNHVFDLKILNAPHDRRGNLTGIYIASSSEHGIAVEIVATPGEDGVGKALALAKQLRATPYLHGGSRSLLASLATIKERATAEKLPTYLILAAQALTPKRAGPVLRQNAGQECLAF
ncbi:enoyl-CoA hydratase-related protein [Bradyrhizobium sp. B097]|uniref:enoyl-CoA hydratase-related protein n=1 Tax=Bradyrhizobium sp. B097 TaxID=3140244 RepID=UPI0031837D1F